VKRTAAARVVLVAVPDRKTAREIARRAVETRLAACVQIVPGLESHYRWQGVTESAKELLLVFKTSAKCLASLEGLVAANHPYTTPQFVVLPIVAGSVDYLAWMSENLAEPARRRGRG
jgi:periplasmic divalent cation tolerance protein